MTARAKSEPARRLRCAVYTRKSSEDDRPEIAEIISKTDLSAIQNEEAAVYWASLDGDIESAIAARLVDRLGENGLSIAVNIDEVKLSNALEQVLELDCPAPEVFVPALAAWQSPQTRTAATVTLPLAQRPAMH